MLDQAKSLISLSTYSHLPGDSLQNDKGSPLGTAELQSITDEALYNILFLSLRPVLKDSLAEKGASLVLSDLGPVANTVLQAWVEIDRRA